ncbi:MAG: 16S rRNA (guanine(966)-N(2))-methyltransferase RsmD [bacterium]|nr:16S rRNA (guanine(966)-N(2))-methyltransferase RsmD [bacterium]
MRIIAGEHKGRRIAPPSGRDTRPMLDRVREALFSTLGEVTGEALVLDLFAGTGSLGLEALSRGAAHAHFVERDPRAVRILNRNIETLRVAEVEVVRGDALEPRSWSAEDDDGPAANVVFLDPPYPMLRDSAEKARLLEAIQCLYETVLRPGGVLVLHAHPRDLHEETLESIATVDRRVYGNSALAYLWKGEG